MGVVRPTQDVTASVSRAASMAVVELGVLVLLGWRLDIPLLKSVCAGLPSMKPNTAITFILAGLSLWLLHPQARNPSAQRIGSACAALTTLISAAILSQYAFSWNLGIDQLISKEAAGAVGTPVLGRMSPITALTFVLVGVALGVLDAPGGRSRHVASGCALAATLISLIAVASYLYGVPSMVGVHAFNQIALHTSVGLVVLCGGILCARPHRGLMAIVTSADLGGVMARRLLTASLGVPLLLGWIRLEGQRLGFYGTEFGVALLAIGSVITLGVVVLWNARLLGDMDSARERARSALAQANAQLEARVQERTRELAAANAALQDSERVLRGIFDNMQDTYFRNDLDGIIRMISPSVRQFGYEPDDLIGHPAAGLYADPADQERIRAALFEHHSVTDFEIPMKRKDGTEVVLATSSHLLLDHEGRPIAVEGVLRDITARKRSEKIVRGLLESAPDAMVIVNRRGEMVLVNSQTERLFGYAREELIRHSVEMLMPPRFHGSHATHRDDYLVTPRVRPMGAGRELYARRKDGSEFPVEISLSPLDTDEGILISCAIRDVTARKQLEQQRADFVAMLAHDIRNPLAIIMGYTDMALESDGVPPAVREFLSATETSARTVLSLVANYLQSAQIDAGELTLRKQPLVVNELLQQICRPWQLACARRHLTLELRLAPDLPIVHGDPVALERVWTNLLQNALKFTPDSGRIVVQSEHHGTHVVVSVADTGPGIAAKDLHKVFERFRQTSTSRAHAGMGLGLFIVKTLVEAHGGTVNVTSTLGAGSRFIVTLPTGDAGEARLVP